MLKKLILFSIIALFFFGFKLAQAEVIINEIQLLPTEGRFLELYNTSDSAVDLTNWYIQRKTATGTSFGSLISKTNFEGKTIGARDYFVISKVSSSNSDIVLDSLTLTESNTIQIKNSNGEVVNKIGWGSASDCGSPCPPNPLEGQSIQKTENGSWVSAISTPGAANATSSNGSSSSSGNSSGSGSFTTNETATEPAAKPTTTQKIKTQIVGKTSGFVGIPFTLEGKAFGSQGEPLFTGKFFWNFGDGDSREVPVTNNEKFAHTYFYPGEYAVLLEYYPNSFTSVPDATEKIIIKVIAPEIIISSVGDEKDFFVELTNNTDASADISSWLLTSDQKSFTIPGNTILASKKKMIISSKITNFSIADKNTLKLMTPQRQIIFNYSSSILPVSPKTNALSKSTTSKTVTKVLANPNPSKSEGDLTASALDSGALEEKGENPYSSLIIPIASIFLIGASAGAVYFIRRKRIVTKAGDNFEILDE